jgi:hypothetical protein
MSEMCKIALNSRNWLTGDLLVRRLKTCEHDGYIEAEIFANDQCGKETELR